MMRPDRFTAVCGMSVQYRQPGGPSFLDNLSAAGKHQFYWHPETKVAPVEALRRWLQAGVEFMATNKGMAAALAMAARGSSELMAYTRSTD